MQIATNTNEVIVALGSWTMFVELQVEELQRRVGLLLRGGYTSSMRSTSTK